MSLSRLSSKGGELALFPHPCQKNCFTLETLCLTYQTKFQTHCKSVYYADIYSIIFDFPLNSEGYAFQYIVTFTA